MLIKGLKFDLRVYVAITSFNPLRIYVYDEGLARFATEKYDSDKNSKYQHLTNYSVNKMNSNYKTTSCEESSKWNFKTL
jgi:hypothetical protein